MRFYAIKVLLLAASIIICFSSMGVAAEPITIFGVNFDHSLDEAREILEDRFDCEFTNDAADNPTVYECIKNNYALVRLISAGNNFSYVHFDCVAWDGCVFNLQYGAELDKIIYNFFVKKYNIPIENQYLDQYPMGFKGLLGESVKLEILQISMRRNQFRAAERLNDLNKLMKVFD
jgi:hypothetical protein